MHLSIISIHDASFIEARKNFGLDLIFVGKDKRGFSVYQCNMLDLETKLCKIYENRPLACRNFPYYQLPQEWNCGYKFIRD